MSQVRPLLSPILVGRDDLVELVTRRLDGVIAGTGHLLLFAGEAGIGKSRMLQAAWRRAAERGFRVSSGALSPQDRSVPLSLVLDLARTLRHQPAFRDLGDRLLAIRSGAAGPRVDALAGRRLLVLEIVECLREAVDRPTMIQLEDLQWADEVSLEVVAELARTTRDRPLMLVGAYRTDEAPADGPLREWRSRLIAQRLAEEARLAALTFDQTALVTTLLLGTGLPAPRGVVAAVYERTDGIPLHIEELLGALHEGARGDERAIREMDVPDTIEDAILARVERLGPEARDVVRAGAVVGRCFVPEVLAGIMGRQVADLDEPLAELVAHSILVPPGPRGLYDFRHQLLRDTVYGSVPAHEARRLHARTAELGMALEGASEIHASVHLERAGLRAEAYRAALAGAEAASRLSSRREAFELYRRAVANVPDDVPAAGRASLHAGFADAAAAIDDHATAEVACLTARRLHQEAGEPIAAAALLADVANLARRGARPAAERRALLERSLAELDGLPRDRAAMEARVDALVGRALLACDVMRLAAARADLDEAALIEAGLGRDDAASDVRFLRGTTEVLAGNVAAGIATTLDTARAARDVGLEGTGVTAYREAAVHATHVMEYAAASEALTEGLRYAEAIQQSHCRHVMAAMSAMVLWAAGRWDEADAAAGQELAEHGCRRGELGAADAAGYVALGRGDIERARHLLEPSLAAGRAAGQVALVLPALWGLAEAALIGGDPVDALARCDEALAEVEGTDERALLVPFVVTGVRAGLAARRPEAAERWLASVSARLGGAWATTAAAAIEHGDGLLRMSAGATVSGRAALESAAAGWTARGRTWEAAWARLDLATCLVRGNRHADAIPLVTGVRRLAEAIGSAPLAARARELGTVARSRGGDEEPWRPLTGREFEVARLVADGLTNAAIAIALDVSPRTAGSHVEHILAKLGVTRRAEIASWVATVAMTSATPAHR